MVLLIFCYARQTSSALESYSLSKQFFPHRFCRASNNAAKQQTKLRVALIQFNYYITREIIISFVNTTHFI